MEVDFIVSKSVTVLNTFLSGPRMLIVLRAQGIKEMDKKFSTICSIEEEVEQVRKLYFHVCRHTHTLDRGE